MASTVPAMASTLLAMASNLLANRTKPAKAYNAESSSHHVEVKSPRKWRAWTGFRCLSLGSAAILEAPFNPLTVLLVAMPGVPSSVLCS